MDNDLPPGTSSWVRNHLHLTYKDPLVPGVAHPGPDVETLADADLPESAD